MFQELGSAPVSMFAARFCDLCSLIRDHVNENADATQAYTQSLLGGTKTSVSLPREEWPSSWKHVKRPVCPLDKALCGRPDARGCWEQHCDNHFSDCGFDPVAPEDRMAQLLFQPVIEVLHDCVCRRLQDFRTAKGCYRSVGAYSWNQPARVRARHHIGRAYAGGKVLGMQPRMFIWLGATNARGQWIHPTT
jgi:hypothetical protein